LLLLYPINSFFEALLICTCVFVRCCEAGAHVRLSLEGGLANSSGKYFRA
jgi:hypothetical protein